MFVNIRNFPLMRRGLVGKETLAGRVASHTTQTERVGHVITFFFSFLLTISVGEHE